MHAEQRRRCPLPITSELAAAPSFTATIAIATATASVSAAADLDATCGQKLLGMANGASIDLDPTPAPGVASLEECKSLCVATLLCEGVLFSNQGQCYRKGDIQVGRCRTDRRFDLYV